MLYKRLLRLHQELPTDMRTMGTLFVREEFKKHKGASVEHAQIFLKEWQVSRFPEQKHANTSVFTMVVA